MATPKSHDSGNSKYDHRACWSGTPMIRMVPFDAEVTFSGGTSKVRVEDCTTKHDPLKHNIDCGSWAKTRCQTSFYNNSDFDIVSDADAIVPNKQALFDGETATANNYSIIVNVHHYDELNTDPRRKRMANAVDSVFDSRVRSLVAAG